MMILWEKKKHVVTIYCNFILFPHSYFPHIDAWMNQPDLILDKDPGTDGSCYTHWQNSNISNV